jgi:AcrR family transcriptional regulator
LNKARSDQSYHHGDLRNALILKALEVLDEKGVTGLSLREIARDIGVGHNAPYRHFKNKTELLEALASVGFRKLKARNVRLELEFANDAETQLFESGMHLLVIATEQPRLFNLMFGGHIELNNCGEELHKEAEESMQSLVKIIVNGQQQGVFIKGDVLKQAVGAMSMVQGLAMMVSSSGLLQHIGREKNQLRGLAVQVFDVLMDGLKK